MFKSIPVFALMAATLVISTESHAKFIRGTAQPQKTIKINKDATIEELKAQLEVAEERLAGKRTHANGYYDACVSHVTYEGNYTMINIMNTKDVLAAGGAAVGGRALFCVIEGVAVPLIFLSSGFNGLSELSADRSICISGISPSEEMGRVMSDNRKCDAVHAEAQLLKAMIEAKEKELAAAKEENKAEKGEANEGDKE